MGSYAVRPTRPGNAGDGESSALAGAAGWAPGYG
jgi:hypothetical protein